MFDKTHFLRYYRPATVYYLSMNIILLNCGLLALFSRSSPNFPLRGKSARLVMAKQCLRRPTNLVTSFRWRYSGGVCAAVRGPFKTTCFGFGFPDCPYTRVFEGGSVPLRWRTRTFRAVNISPACGPPVSARTGCVRNRTRMRCLER